MHGHFYRSITPGDWQVIVGPRLFYAIILRYNISFSIFCRIFVTTSENQQLWLRRKRARQQVEEGRFRTCTYEEAHNRVYGAIEFAEEAGIEPSQQSKMQPNSKVKFGQIAK